MLQRRPPIEDFIGQLRYKYRAEVVNLNRIPSSSGSSALLLELISQADQPLIASQVLRDDMVSTKSPHLPYFELILQKAELFYTESLLYDLSKMTVDTYAVQITAEEVRASIQQLNWKLSVEKSSVLNESQELGENVDLMKFFQGVRNYQNCQEAIQKQCIEVLKVQSHRIETQLSAQRGYSLGRISSVFEKKQKECQRQLFVFYHKGQKLRILAAKFFKIKQKQLSAGFQVMKKHQKNTPLSQILSKLGKAIFIRNCLSTLRNLQLKKVAVHQKLQLLVSKISRVLSCKEVIQKQRLFNKLDDSKAKKAYRVHSSVNTIVQFMRKIAFRATFGGQYVYLARMCNIIQEKFTSEYAIAFESIKDQEKQCLLQDNLKEKAKLSLRLKGKILMSLEKYERTPIDIRKTFLKWYMNAHSNRYARQVYNIWLQGNVSKFTVFMRLKNIVDLMKKKKVSPQLKTFLLVLRDKQTRYEQQVQKHYVSQWVNNTRRRHKMQSMFGLLDIVSQRKKAVFLKESYQLLYINYKKMFAIGKYCNKCVLRGMNNARLSLGEWKHIPNVKKEQGRTRLRQLLGKVTTEIQESKQRTLDMMKRNLKEGHSKKVNLMEKARTQDKFYLQKYLQIWRGNKEMQIKEESHYANTFETQKCNSLKEISRQFTHMRRIQSLRVISLFVTNSVRVQAKRNATRNIIERIINENHSKTTANTFLAFTHALRNGRIKKQVLTDKFVRGITQRLRSAFSLFHWKSLREKELLKIKKLEEFMRSVTQQQQENYLIFDKKTYCFKVLSKIFLNRTDNISRAFKTMITMPERMEWNRRERVLRLYDQFKHQLSRNLQWSYAGFRISKPISFMTKKKAVGLMCSKYLNVKRKYFLRYHSHITKMKIQSKYDATTRLFQTMEAVARDSLQIVWLAESVWKIKAEHLDKLSKRVQKRMQGAMRLWIDSCLAIKHSQRVLQEKKLRQLESLNKLFQDSTTLKVKHCIELFNRNSNIQRLQINFLKRLCDGKVGKLLKGIMIWKNLPEPKNKERIVRATKFQANLQRMTVRNLKFTLVALKDIHYFGNQQKKYCIRKLVARCSSGIGQYFQKWRANNKLSLLFTRCSYVSKMFQVSNSKLEDMLETLKGGKESHCKQQSVGKILDYWEKKKQRELIRWKEQVRAIKAGQKMKSIRLQELQYLISTAERKKKSQIVGKFLMNRSKAIGERKKFRVQHILRVLELQNEQRRLMLNTVHDMFHSNHYKGNFKKNKAFSKFLQMKIKDVQSDLSIWQQLSNLRKQEDRGRRISQTIAIVEDALKANFSPLFGDRMENIVKKRQLERLFRAQEIKYRGYFALWRAHAGELRILGELDKKTKAVILERISKMVDSTSKDSVLRAVKMFQLNRRITDVQVKFMQRLLMTKSGKTVEAIKKWKSIPMSRLFDKYKNYQKFFSRLEGMRRGRLQLLIRTFKDEKQDGQNKKRQSVLELIRACSHGTRSFYNRWQKITKETQLLKRVSKTDTWMAEMEQQIGNQLLIVFEDQRGYELKIAVIQKLVAATKNRTKQYFSAWRENLRELKMMESLSKEGKKKALAIFGNILGSSNITAITQIIQKFSINSKVVRISRSFFNKLMGTKTGKVLQLLHKMKGIPDVKINKKKKKAILFEAALNRQAMKRLREVHACMKQCTYDSNAKRKYCIDRLLRACMGENHKKFIVWRNVVREGKILAHTQTMEGFFMRLTMTTATNFGILIKDTTQQIQKKKGLSRKLIASSLFVQHHAYLRWRQALHRDEIRLKEHEAIVTSDIRNLAQVHQNYKKRQAMQIIKVFRKVLELRHLQESHDYKDYKNRKCIQFHERLGRIVNKSKGIFISNAKDSVIQSTMVHKMRSLESVFRHFNHALSNNYQQLIKFDEELALKEKIVTILFKNIQKNIAKVIALWREQKNILQLQMTIGNEKKKSCLNILNRILGSNGEVKVTEAIRLFAINYKQTKLMREILLKMIVTRSGKMPVLFMRWKSLPYQGAKKAKQRALQFEKRLSRLHFQRLASAFNGYRHLKQEGDNKKKHVARLIVQASMSDSSRVFNKWRKINNEAKVVDKIFRLEEVFKSIDDRLCADMGYLFKSIESHPQNEDFPEFNPIYRVTKPSIATRLFNCQVNNLSHYFKKWQSQADQIKLVTLNSALQPYNPEKHNRQLLRSAFAMIQKRKDTVQLRGHINSLWKWKLSNMEANYYGKFMRVFRESEELMTLSLLFNRRFQENTQQAFSNIRAYGQHLRNRKIELVDKYLTRKCRVFFSTFRASTSRKEILAWRQKYTGSIKGKMVNDAFKRALLRVYSLGMNNLRRYAGYCAKVDTLTRTLNSFQQALALFAIFRIKSSKFEQIQEKIVEFIQKKKHSAAQTALAVVKDTARVKFLHSSINLVLLSFTRRFALAKIYNRKENTIKYPLAINLLNQIKSNRMAKEVRRAVQKLLKNKSRFVAAARMEKVLGAVSGRKVRVLFEKEEQKKANGILLARFQRASAIKSIMDKQDNKLAKKYLQKMREKENAWMEKSIRMFATRASIRSSIAICVWRMKTYGTHQRD